MKPFRQHGVAFGREMQFDFRCSYNITTNDITAKKNIKNEQFIQNTKGDGALHFDLNFYETSKFEQVTEQKNITIGNLMFFDIRARAPVPGLNFFVHECVVNGAEPEQTYNIIDKGCLDHYTKTSRYDSYTNTEFSRFSYTGIWKKYNHLRFNKYFI